MISKDSLYVGDIQGTNFYKTLYEAEQLQKQRILKERNELSFTVSRLEKENKELQEKLDDPTDREFNLQLEGISFSGTIADFKRVLSIIQSVNVRGKF